MEEVMKEAKELENSFQKKSNPFFWNYTQNEVQGRKSQIPDQHQVLSILMDEAAISNHYELTKREMEVIRWIFSGMSNKEIAQELNIAESTVKRHIWNIFNKTGAENRTHLLYIIRI